MPYSPPAYKDVGGTIALSYVAPAYTDVGGNLGVPVVDPPDPPPAGVASDSELPVIVVQLTVDGVVSYFSDMEYGDGGLRWHDARVTGDIVWSRRAAPALWQQNAIGGLGNIELINTDGALDGFLVDAQADASVIVYVVAQGALMSSAVAIAAAVVTRIEAQGEQTIRIVTGDVLDLLDVPLQPDVYLTGEGDATLVGRPRPVAIGNPLSCPVVLVDGIDYEYDCQDSDAFTVVKVRDMGIELVVAVPPAPGYQVDVAPIFGIELNQTPVGRVVADISATTFVAESIISAAEGNFATDILGWTVATDTSGGGTASAVWSAGTAVISANGTGATSPGPFVDFSWPDNLVAGQTYSYSCSCNVTISASGIVQVQFRPNSLVPAEYVQLLIATVTGTNTLSGTFVAPSAGKLFFRAATVANEQASAVIDNVLLSRVAAGGDVADVAALLLARAGIGASQISASSIAALAAARPWAVSYWADTADSVRSVLQQLMDSVYGWMTTDNLGRVVVGYLKPPEALDAVVATITQQELAGEIEIEPDLAPGLSTTVAGARNWYRYGEGELADAVPDADRPILTTDYRIRKTSVTAVGIELGPRAGGSVSDLSDSGIPTLLDDATDLQAAANYLADLYPAGLPRRFYRIPCFLSLTAFGTLALGDKIKLVYPRFGCGAGRDLRLVGIEGRAGDDLCVLYGWGSAVDP